MRQGKQDPKGECFVEPKRTEQLSFDLPVSEKGRTTTGKPEDVTDVTKLAPACTLLHLESTPQNK